MFQKTEEMLSMLNQQHLIKYKDELSKEELEKLIYQIKSLDLSVLSATENPEKRGKFSPIYVKSLDEIKKNDDYYTALGLQAIKYGKVGAVLLAGGQGSRLGFDKPKGMFNIGESKDLYIFECLINNLLDVVRKADAWIPLFIMTSAENDVITKQFFKEQNYFGYSKDNIFFFQQEELPTVDTNGKLMLSDKNCVSTAPNGNGGWYYSMVRSGTISILEKSNIEWLNVFAVDNVLQKMADPAFIGAVIDSGKESGSKVVAKAFPDEKVGVMCLEDGKPSIIEYYEMNDEMRHAKDNKGNYLYNYGVILNYIFRVKNLNRTLERKLPLHKAFKKIKYYENGKFVSPEEPNAYKFETLVLDMIRMQDSCLPFEVDRKKEFAPVKNKEGVDSVDTARELLKLNGIEI